MANYHYDEAGTMAAYFVITVLALVLIPMTLSSLSSSSSKKETLDGCQCQPCLEMRIRIRQREQGSLWKPRVSTKSLFIVLGWSLFAFLTRKAMNASVEGKVYDPFEILGLRNGVTEKEIKSHFKKLSRLYHPDKVKASINETAEDIAARFVDITKAYKSLTDETIRQNWELYGHPDGRQEVSMGIALPKWIIEGKNNIWVLGLYGLIFGGALPALVGRWWFGSRQKTKDGINALTAANFFKSLKEESGMKDAVSSLGRAFRWEITNSPSTQQRELDSLDAQISEKLGQDWNDIKKMVGTDGKLDERERKALIFLYSHFLHLQLPSSIEREQTDVILQTPLLLNALLNIAASRSWLSPTLSVMRLHACMVQASLPEKEGSPSDDFSSLGRKSDAVKDIMKGDYNNKPEQAQKVLQNRCRLDIVDVSFKVIGERLVTPSSIVFLFVKLRLCPLSAESAATGSANKDQPGSSNDRDDEFLNSKKDAEDLEGNAGGWAHAPFWPGYRKAGWWLVLADDKSNRIVVPPMKVTDIPVSNSNQDGDYRSYKLQFQAPQNVGLFTWKIYFVSDTFVDEEICRDISLKIDDVAALTADEQAAEDDISEPEEDTLAGQMAAMRGGSVKRSQGGMEQSDDESSTDDDRDSEGSTDSDSD
ncbi:hypothetical protein SERLA73DRAFT_67885 [Serpula lacrymans var. lacrymans S7.3]|uniref:J domain-containing protein n=1 Tax=Serpula lacrymans var. lacrymans (strain S7.3) TaxID=936435 RepID=F8PEV8_SERL3|nr:hypothetical protein SERLA73DRAFT_67885 [Serpula lacrymans var. lacrymans S7.3]